jgi:hypothetical protein
MYITLRYMRYISFSDMLARKHEGQTPDTEN